MLDAPTRPRVVTQEFLPFTGSIYVLTEWDAPSLAAWDLKDVVIQTFLNSIECRLDTGALPSVHILSPTAAQLVFPYPYVNATLRGEPCKAYFSISKVTTRCGQELERLPADIQKDSALVDLTCSRVNNLLCPHKDMQPQLRIPPLCDPVDVKPYALVFKDQLAIEWRFPEPGQGYFPVEPPMYYLIRYSRVISADDAERAPIPPIKRRIQGTDAIPLKITEPRPVAEEVEPLGIKSTKRPFINLPAKDFDTSHDYRLQVCAIFDPDSERLIDWNAVSYRNFAITEKVAKEIERMKEQRAKLISNALNTADVQIVKEPINPVLIERLPLPPQPKFDPKLFTMSIKSTQPLQNSDPAPPIIHDNEPDVYITHHHWSSGFSNGDWHTVALFGLLMITIMILMVASTWSFYRRIYKTKPIIKEGPYCPHHVKENPVYNVSAGVQQLKQAEVAADAETAQIHQKPPSYEEVTETKEDAAAAAK